jgi:hypothetical protein
MSILQSNTLYQNIIFSFMRIININILSFIETFLLKISCDFIKRKKQILTIISMFQAYLHHIF